MQMARLTEIEGIVPSFSEFKAGRCKMTLDFQDGLKLEIDAVAVSLDVENTLHRLDTFGGGTAVIGKTTRISVIADAVDCVMAEPGGRPGPGVEALIRTIRFMKKGRGQ